MNTLTAFSLLGLDAKDSVTILISLLTLLVTIITNIFMQIYWNRRKLAADLKSKSRIEWIQDVRKLTAELLSMYYRILSYEKASDYRLAERFSKTYEKLFKALGQEKIQNGSVVEEDNKKYLLASAQEKTQLLMLYFGAEVTMDLMEFDEKQARIILMEAKRKTWGVHLFDENDGKNKWISALLKDTYTCFLDGYEDDEDLNIKIKKAGEDHSKAQEKFINFAIKSGLMYNNVAAETWTDDDKNNKKVDEELLKAKRKLEGLNHKKEMLYKRLDFIREATSIYLKHEWDRAKRGK